MILEFIQTYMNYIIGYFGFGFIWFLIQYGRIIRKITRHNQIYRRNQLKVNWGYMIGMCWVLWPFEAILRLIKFISLIGV